MEFWNRSLKTVGSLDGTVVGPGPAGSPNIREDGSLYWSLTGNDPRYDYGVGEWPCVQFAGIGRACRLRTSFRNSGRTAEGRRGGERPCGFRP